MNDVPHHDELPLPDYDHLPVGSLGHRIRSLDADGVTALLDYERAHGDRLPVVQVLQHRLTELEDGAPTSGGDPTAVAPEAPLGEASDSLGSASRREGPAVNPPSHGDPTNPAQPRT
ncbi:hypothetical protein FE634_04150 [Nocardioides dongxiaopingii]|uniref:hypothetical protein n=1 Tax=Nocardioides sp. S-1144 TaxID=2582905 RepID=UPI00110F65B9|nr:hypothetical protein [Nocardioides sp. S-1144]QCW49803.1 hypothetical protein FE634_04150 [Nocardioides sp. S-1144]